MDTTTPNRAERRRAARAQAREAGNASTRTWRKSAVALSAAAAVTFGAMGGAGLARADDAPPMEMTPEMILDLLDNEMLTGFVEMCRTGALANGNPNAGQSTNWNAEDTTQGTLPPNAIATCTDSTGHGLALVLPDTFEIGDTAQSMYMDLGPDQNILGLLTFKMGNQNLFNIIGGLLFDAPKVIGLVSVRDQAQSMYGISIDPRMFEAFSSYDEVVTAAALPVKPATADRCVDHLGRDIGAPVFLLGCTLSGSTRVNKGQDLNAIRRNQGLAVAEYLTGATYPRGGPVQLPRELPKAKGQSTIKGDGINVALSMRNGRAVAETGNNLAVALAGADHGKLSSAFAKYGIAVAANMDTEDIRFTWFGQEVDFTKLLAAGLLDSEMAQEAGAAEMGPMLGMIGGLNGTIPSLKEVYCLGIEAKATAEGLGSCSNYLGTFDTYKDLRPLTNGSNNFTGDSVSRQEQYGLTDLSSLAFGNNALLSSLAPLLSGGDMGDLMSNPVIGKMLAALISEDQRLKLTNDFIRYTKNVETVFAKEPVLDAQGNPVLQPVKIKVQKKDAEGNPVLDANGKPVLEEVNKQEQAKDADGNPLWNDAEQTDPTMVDVMVPVLKNKVTARMVGAEEDAWEKYISTDPVLLTRNVQVQDADVDGSLLWVDANGQPVAAGTEGAQPKLVDKKEQAKNADGKLLWTLNGADVLADENGEVPAGATPKMVVVTEQVQDRNADGSLKFKEKTRYLKKPVMTPKLDDEGNVVTEDFKDADGKVVWVDDEGNVVDEGTEGATKKQTPVLVQKMEQAKDDKGNLLWDPVVEKSTTAHWLTSDYGLREPLVIEWMGHQVVFFPAVEVNGTYRPNLIGLPEIKKITEDAHTGLLPKINLVQWDNAFGLGTWTFDKPWDVFGTVSNYSKSVTLFDDLKQIDGLLGITDGIKKGLDEQFAPVRGFLDQGWLDLMSLFKKAPQNPDPEECVPAEPSTENPEGTTCPEVTDPGDDEGAGADQTALLRATFAPQLPADLGTGDDDSAPEAAEPTLGAPAATPEPEAPAVEAPELDAPTLDGPATPAVPEAPTAPAVESPSAPTFDDPAPAAESPAAPSAPAAEADAPSGDLVGAGLGE